MFFQPLPSSLSRILFLHVPFLLLSITPLPVLPGSSSLACTTQPSQIPTQDNPTTPTPVRVGVTGLPQVVL
ncbi:hypothetical protein KCU86_g63, partial [Aureobasidium melanogenum]